MQSSVLLENLSGQQHGVFVQSDIIKAGEMNKANLVVD